MAVSAVVDHYRLERALLRYPGGASLAELGRATGIPQSTLLEHLRTAREYQRAEQLADKRWRPSPAWLTMLLQSLANRGTDASTQ